MTTPTNPTTIPTPATAGTTPGGSSPLARPHPDGPAGGVDPNLAVQASAALRIAATRPALAGTTPQLSRLADDLASEDPTRLARWVDVDLQAALDPATVVAAPEHPHARWHAVLGHVNTVLLILPLLVTWVGLRSASAGYAALVEEDPDAAAQPFFALWQTGFGGTSETFGAVVAWMLFALCLLAGGQLAARVLSQRIESQAAEVETAVGAELQRALLLASCALSETRQGLPAEVDARLRASVTALQESAGETRQLLTSLQRATTKAQKLIDTHLDALDRAPDALERATTALSAAATSLDGSTRQVGSAIGEVATQLATVDAGHRDLGTTLAGALVKHDDAAAARLAVASVEARSAHADLVAAIGLSLGQVTDVLARDADQSASRFTAAHAQLGSTIEDLTAALADSRQIHEVGAAATQSQISALEEMLDRAHGLSAQIAALDDTMAERRTADTVGTAGTAASSDLDSAAA